MYGDTSVLQKLFSGSLSSLAGIDYVSALKDSKADRKKAILAWEAVKSPLAFKNGAR